MSLPDEDRVQFAADLYADPVKFCRVILSDWFKLKMPWVHRGMLALILKRGDFLLNFGKETWAGEEAEWTEKDFAKIRKHFIWKDAEGIAHPIFDEVGNITASDQVVQIMPRGTSKTTLMNAAVLYMIMYQIRKFIVYVSETATHAERQIGNIKREIESNEPLRAIFGDVAATKADAEKWQAGEFQTITGVAVVARGRGSQIRGMNINANRPDLILLDDVEDKESVSTAEQRKKTLDWYQSDVFPARSEFGGTYFFLLGTLLHKEALLPTLGKDPSYNYIVFGMVDPDGDMLWPAMMSREKLEARKNSYVRTGTLTAFYFEYLSSGRADEDAKFREEYIQREVVDPDKLIARAIAIDPAISQRKGSSVCVTAVVGITEFGRIHVLEVYGKPGMTPREQVDKYFELAIKWDCTHHGVESIGYQASLIHLLQAEMFVKGKLFGPKAYFEITPITHKAQKEARILGTLQPRYAAGYVKHQAIFPELEEALVDWPNGQMDYPDAVAMALSLLDPFASLSGEGDAPEGAEDPFKQVVSKKGFRSAP